MRWSASESFSAKSTVWEGRGAAIERARQAGPGAGVGAKLRRQRAAPRGLPVRESRMLTARVKPARTVSRHQPQSVELRRRRRRHQHGRPLLEGHRGFSQQCPRLRLRRGPTAGAALAGSLSGRGSEPRLGLAARNARGNRGAGPGRGCPDGASLRVSTSSGPVARTGGTQARSGARQTGAWHRRPCSTPEREPSALFQGRHRASRSPRDAGSRQWRDPQAGWQSCRERPAGTSPGRRRGGLGRAHQILGEQLPKLFGELNEVLAA